MKLKLKESRDFGLLVLRVGVGLMFVLVHGLPKVMGAYPRGPDLEELSIDSRYRLHSRVLGISGHALRVWRGLCLIAGVLFRPACGFMLFTLVIAVASIIRGGYGFSSASQPIELGLVLLSLIFTGPGRFTLPNLFPSIRTLR